MVDYFTNPDVPGKEFFRCDRYSATLSVESCSAMWRKGNREGDERRERCKGCTLGAKHAGEQDASSSPLMGALVCVRCENGATRLINKMLCVSCYNRQREWVIGRNSKGTKPVKLQKLEPRSLRYFAGADLITLHMPLSADPSELVIAALRDSKKQVSFCFNGAIQQQCRQLSLF